jgi:glycosyltransferase involved in cell wall biosynthesis
VATLILTLPPHIPGGVAAKAKTLADYLRSAGQDVTIAFYAARGKYPELNVSLNRVFSSQRPKTLKLTEFGDHNCVAVGCRFPELESSYTEPSLLWDKLITAHDHHIAVGGTVLMANPFITAGVQHLVWCACDIEGDRRARRNAMGYVRKILDGFIITPKLEAQEQRVLSSLQNRILGVSPYSITSLKLTQPNAISEMDVLPIPTDMDFFSPDGQGSSKLEKPIIGFAGRLDDPRKNPNLLFQSFAQICKLGIDASLHVTGSATPELLTLAEMHGISDHIQFLGRLSRDELKSFYQSLSLFLIPSEQEGLAIVGIEAMACGVPVVSTKCGGPEAYVQHGINGYLCGFNAEEIAKRASELLENKELYLNVSNSARASVLEEYAQNKFRGNFSKQWFSLWGVEM